MKVVILAGGYGTRISEESHLRPKPMIEIGQMPILWHIMKLYSYYGFQEFVICAGYKQDMIKEWFANYYLHNSDVTFDFSKGNKLVVHHNEAEPWKVTVVDTGLDTPTAGRIKKIQKYTGEEPFFLTYGDGVSNVDVAKQLEYHKKHGAHMTMTTVGLTSLKGLMDIDENNNITVFREKAADDVTIINGGFMICNPQVFDYIHSEEESLESDVLNRLAKEGQLKSYSHKGFWQCMDTKREKDYLETLWAENKAPWKLWE